tara:strand:+ start:958 stop:1623 length:666 start_codon:yes stop_codon:yes gene_type:complete
MSITTLNDWNGVSLRVTTHDDAKKELDRCVIVYARDEEDALNVARNNGFNPTYKKHCSKSLVMQMKKRFVYIDKDYWETDEPIRLCDPFKFLHDALDILKTIKEREPSKDPEDDSCGINCFYKSLTFSREDLEREGIFCSEKTEGIKLRCVIEKLPIKQGGELSDWNNPAYYSKGDDHYKTHMSDMIYYVAGQSSGSWDCLEECGYDRCNPEFVLWKVKVN